MDFTRIARVLTLALFAQMATGQAMDFMDIRDAVLDENIEISLRGLDHGELGYDDKEVWIGILNIGKRPVTITVEPGFILHSEEDDVQDMIITERLEMVASHEHYNEFGADAMCIQASNKSPGYRDDFTPWNYADGNMRQLALFIHEQGYQNHMGQEAMWSVSDGHSVYNISGRAFEANPIRQFVADLTGVAFDTSLVDKDLTYIERTLKEYALYLDFNLGERADIKLQVFNQKGEHDRDLMMYRDQVPGRYSMRYKISLFGMLGEKYYVRLYVGDEMRNEFTLLIKDS